MPRNKKEHYITYNTFHKQCREQVNAFFPGPGGTRFGKIDGKKFSIHRAEYLDRYGNPVYTATIYDSKGRTVGQNKSNGNPYYNLEKALEKSGTKVK